MGWRYLCGCAWAHLGVGELVARTEAGQITKGVEAKQAGSLHFIPWALGNPDVYKVREQKF